MRLITLLLLCALAISVRAQTFSAIDSLAKGISLGVAKDYDASDDMYRKIVRHYEANQPPLEPAYFLGYRRLGMSMKALDKPDSVRYCFLKANALFEQQPVDSLADDAVDNYNQVIVYYGYRNQLDSVEVWCDLAEDFMDRNDIPPLRSVASYYSNLSILHRIRGAFRESFGAAQRSIEISRDLPGLAPSEIAQSYVGYARSLTNAGFCRKAQRYLDTAILYFARDTMPQDDKIGETFIRKAECYQQTGDHAAKMEALTNARQVLRRALDPNHERFAFLYHFYANHYRHFKDFERAILYQQRVIDILEENIAIDEGREFEYLRVDLGTAHGNMGDLLMETGDLDSVAYHYQRSLDADLEGLEEGHGDLAQSYLNFGDLYAALDDHTRSLEYYDKAEGIILSFYGPTHPETAAFYRDLGHKYYERGAYVLARDHFLRAGEIAEAIGAEDRTGLVESSYRLGLVMQELDSTAMADTYFNRALTEIGVRLDSITQVEEGREEQALRVLTALAALHAEDHEQALAYLLPAEQLLQQLVRISATGQASQFRFLERYSSVYQLIQEALLQRGDTRLALQYCEQSKSALLRQNWIESSVESTIPVDLLEEKRNLAYELSNNQRRLQADPENADLLKHLVALEQELSDLESAIDAGHPEFAAFVSRHQLPDLAPLASSDAVFLSYSVGDEEGFAYVVRRDSVQAFNMTTQSLPELTEALIAGVAGQGDVNTLDSICRVLGARLLQPLMDAGWDTDLAMRLVVIPDGYLAQVPFELLIVPGSGQRLIEQVPVSYLASIDMLTRESDHGPGNAFAGFAPEYGQQALADTDTLEDSSLAMLVRSGHYALPGAAEEVALITTLLKGVGFVGAEASERNFVDKAGSFGILHLSMHAIPDFNNPGASKLLFTEVADSVYDNQLTSEEIHQMRLGAEMAVLSACQTGVGQIRRGEGSLSLARAFAMAGVPATVTSLWKVPDAASSDIMVRFYTHLKAGMPKDQALRQAKLDYLAAAKYEAQRHPVHWAGFIVTGDPGPLSGGGQLWWLAVLVLGGSLVFVLRSRG